MIPIVFFLFVVLAVVIFVIFWIKTSSHRKCGKCKGLGYWEGTRRRESCDDCGGSGKIEKNPQ